MALMRQREGALLHMRPMALLLVLFALLSVAFFTYVERSRGLKSAVYPEDITVFGVPVSGPSPYPRIYVAELPDELVYDYITNKAIWFNMTYGAPLGEPMTGDDVGLRNTNQFALDTHLLVEMLTSPLRVASADEADIVFVPCPAGRADPYRDTDTHLFLDFFNQTEEMYRRYLPALGTKPHVLGFSRVAWDYADLFVNNSASKLFTFTTIENLVGKPDKDNENLVVLPYPAAQHWHRGSPHYRTSGLPFDSAAVASSKKVLVSQAFVSRLHFRKLLKDDCEGQEEDCVHTEWRNDLAVKVLGITRSSWYCFQPPGDSPTRKSFWDCILEGTVPVIFDEDLFSTLPFSDVVPWRDILVVIPKEKVDDEGLNAVMLLKELHTTQSALRRLELLHGALHALQYSLNPDHLRIRWDQVGMVHPQDDAFTFGWKAIISSLCQRGQLPRQRCSAARGGGAWDGGRRRAGEKMRISLKVKTTH